MVIYWISKGNKRWDLYIGLVRLFAYLELLHHLLQLLPTRIGHLDLL